MRDSKQKLKKLKLDDDNHEIKKNPPRDKKSVKPLI